MNENKSNKTIISKLKNRCVSDKCLTNILIAQSLNLSIKIMDPWEWKTVP